jgi:hypothetical protein
MKKWSSLVNLYRLMHALSIITPVAVLMIIAIQLLLFGVHASYISSWIMLIFMSFYLAWFLRRRSQDTEAAFFSTRVRATDDEARKLGAETVAVAGAAFIVLLTLLLPWLRA